MPHLSRVPARDGASRFKGEFAAWEFCNLERSSVITCPSMSVISDIVIRPARLSDHEALARMLADLWPQSSVEKHDEEVSALLRGTAALTMPLVIFVAEASEGPIGFLEVDLRSHADGCSPGKAVGYLEGWYVERKYRQQGVGKKLVEAAEEWARGHGCIEIGSDALIDNETSQRAHAALGYEVVDRCVNYRKTL